MRGRVVPSLASAARRLSQGSSSSYGQSLRTFRSSTLPCTRPPSSHATRQALHLPDAAHLSRDADPLARYHFSRRCSTEMTEAILAALRSPPDDSLAEEAEDSSEEAPLLEEAAKRMLDEGEEESISATKGGDLADQLGDWWIDEGDGEEAGVEPVEACKAQSEEDADYTQAVESSTIPDDQEGIDEAVDALEFHWREGNQAMLLTLEEVKEVLQNVRAKDVQVVPVHDRCEWTDLMVLATGKSVRHVHGIAEALVYKVKKKGNVDSTLLPTIEGQEGGRWLVVDSGNIIIHVLNEEARAYYNLEKLWCGSTHSGSGEKEFEKMLSSAGKKKNSLPTIS